MASDDEDDDDTNTTKKTASNFCFLLVSVAGGHPQRLVIELFRDICPKTCHNFASLCEAPGRTNPSRPVATYRGSIFHRVVPQFMVQGGDFENFSGSGGYSVLSSSSSTASASRSTRTTFPDESFAISHNKAGMVSMANKGKDTNGSQFFITLQPTLHLDKKHVVFGKVIEGMATVQSMGTDVELEGTRPAAMQKIVVVDCGIGKGDGVIDGGDDNIDSGDGSGEENTESRDRDQKRRQQRKEKKDRRKSHKEAKRKKKHSKSKSKKNKHRHDFCIGSESEDNSVSSASTISRDGKRQRKHKDSRSSHSNKKERKRSHSSSRRRRDDYSSSNSSSDDSVSSDDGPRKKHRKHR